MLNGYLTRINDLSAPPIPIEVSNVPDYSWSLTTTFDLGAPLRDLLSSTAGEIISIDFRVNTHEYRLTGIARNRISLQAGSGLGYTIIQGIAAELRLR